MKTRIAINGFGRIGRQIFRIAMQRKDLEVVAVNNISSNKIAAHLLKYDSNYGPLNAEVKPENENAILVNNQKVLYFQERDPAKIPWEQAKVDIVLEATGIFTKKEHASKHLRGTVKKVIITAAGKDSDAMICMGVNEKSYDPKSHHIISNASCTTNCMAPIVKVLNDTLKIKKGLMTTTHAYTNDQRLQDDSHEDLRRARAAALSMIPTSTGAATAVAEVIPEMKGKLNGMAVRVPTPTVSLLDFTCEVDKKTSKEEVNEILKQAAKSNMKGILDYTDEPLVSIDFKGNTHSAIVDGLSTLVMGDNMVKVVAWYDNEWGYSERVVDLTELIASKL